jgi:hypothetical protein
MTLMADMRSPRLWHLWNTSYRYGSDASDEGFILRTEQGWALHQRGGRAPLRDTYPTLDDALNAAGVEQRQGR